MYPEATLEFLQNNKWNLGGTYLCTFLHSHNQLVFCICLKKCPLFRKIKTWLCIFTPLKELGLIKLTLGQEIGPACNSMKLLGAWKWAFKASSTMLKLANGLTFPSPLIISDYWSMKILKISILSSKMQTLTKCIKR